MKETLTERQQSIYEFIEEYQLRHGYSPKIMEIQRYFDIKSVNGVIKHLEALEKKGWIVRDNTPRGIKLLEKALEKMACNVMKVPIFGTIPAGNPQHLSEFVEGYLPIELSLVGNRSDVFALFVKGESMIDAGIFEGDVVLCVKREPRIHDIVVALVDGESTLKRLVRNKEDGELYLKAENAQFSNIYPRDSLEIQGVCVYVVRQLAQI